MAARAPGDAMTAHPASQPASPWTIKGKLCLITGATSGIGAATATELAGQGAHVLLVARDPARGRAAAAAITAAHPGAQLEVMDCDLARMDDVRRLARTVEESYGRLDVLVNNAGVVNFTRRTTADGYEQTFAVNHLAPFLLTTLLRPALAVPAEARVLTVTSDNHKTIRSVPWDDLQSERGYKPLQVYNRTKLMNIWFTQALACSLADTAITANCASPGFVRTRLARDATGVLARHCGGHPFSPRHRTRDVRADGRLLPQVPTRRTRRPGRRPESRIATLADQRRTDRNYRRLGPLTTGDRTVESQQGDCPMPQQAGLNQLNLVVRDMDATLGFYRRLGLDVEADPGAFHAAAHLPSGMLIEWDRAEFFSQWNTGWNGTTGGSAVLGFWLTSREAVDDLYTDLTGAGHNGHQPPYDAFWGGRYAIVEDPDGNSIGLMSPTDPTLEYWPPNPPPQATSS